MEMAATQKPKIGQCNFGLHMQKKIIKSKKRITDMTMKKNRLNAKIFD